MSRIETLTTTLRHRMSSANDALAEFTIAHDAKAIFVAMQTLDGTSFFSADLLEQFIFHELDQRHGIVAYDDDTVPLWTPKRTDWRLFAIIGGSNFAVKVIKHRHFSGPDDIEFVVELFPATITLAALDSR